MWNLAKAYQTRPSSMLRLFDPVECFYLDRSVMHFGSALEEALMRAVDQGKRKKPLSEAMKNQKTQEVLNRWLGESAAPKRYRDPAIKLRDMGEVGA